MSLFTGFFSPPCPPHHAWLLLTERNLLLGARSSFNPFYLLFLKASTEPVALQCLGTHLEGPLDASTSLVRQQSAAEQAGCCRVNVQYTTKPASVLSCSEPGRHSPGQTRRLRGFQRFCRKFGVGGTPAGACCHCVLKACEVCMAWA